MYILKWTTMIRKIYWVQWFPYKMLGELEIVIQKWKRVIFITNSNCASIKQSVPLRLLEIFNTDSFRLRIWPIPFNLQNFKLHYFSRMDFLLSLWNEFNLLDLTKPEFTFLVSFFKTKNYQLFTQKLAIANW